ncbi:VOC family protein [Lentzea sp. NPDC004782]|uniref:VOC family protein n=1 Tax=Lentzea sp. NPDC004782 TaxID=3154458 RepID=UPI0033A692E8
MARAGPMVGDHEAVPSDTTRACWSRDWPAGMPTGPDHHRRGRPRRVDRLLSGRVRPASRGSPPHRRPGPTTFGLLVDDLDARHSRALAAGATEVVAPRDRQGMPRSAAVRDPDGNRIWLYQG